MLDHLLELYGGGLLLALVSLPDGVLLLVLVAGPLVGLAVEPDDLRIGELSHELALVRQSVVAA